MINPGPDSPGPDLVEEALTGRTDGIQIRIEPTISGDGREAVPLDLLDVLNGQTIQRVTATGIHASVDPSGPEIMDIEGQLVLGMRTGLEQGQQQVTIQLHPPGLGRVLIEFKRDEDWIDGRLEVSSRDTYLSLERGLSDVAANLHSQGIQLRNLELRLNEQPQSHDMSPGRDNPNQPDQRQPRQSDQPFVPDTAQPMPLQKGRPSGKIQQDRPNGSVDILA